MRVPNGRIEKQGSFGLLVRVSHEGADQWSGEGY
jgi:hypothetical protein